MLETPRKQTTVHSIWNQCVDYLQDELPSQQFNTWIKPLRVEGDDHSSLKLLAPNRFISDWVAEKYLRRIRELVGQLGGQGMPVALEVLIGSGVGFKPATTLDSSPNPNELTAIDRTGHPGVVRVASVDNPAVDQPPQLVTPQSLSLAPVKAANTEAGAARAPVNTSSGVAKNQSQSRGHRSNLNTGFTFDSFVVGKSNQLGLAAARQVAENPGGSYNPLFVYGGVGLGKTHLMQSIGNALLQKNADAKVLYLHSERFVADMIKALQLNAMNDFKRYYRSVDALMIDDIQFFAGKDRSQEEFFHTFNALLEGGQQIILTCDRYPKEIDGLEERLKSRFGWGLTVAIEPPELETRVAILMKKAEETAMDLPNDAAFFIAQRIRSNVRELEGALKRVIASAHFTGRKIDVELVREALKDLLALQDKQVSVDNIQRVVAEYYKIKISDLLSKRRSRSVARPRQVGMFLAKELTNHSLPEIGDVFGGRDHTTVLHACRKIKSLREESADIREDVKNLLRTLTT